MFNLLIEREQAYTEPVSRLLGGSLELSTIPTLPTILTPPTILIPPGKKPTGRTKPVP